MSERNWKIPLGKIALRDFYRFMYVCAAVYIYLFFFSNLWCSCLTFRAKTEQLQVNKIICYQSVSSKKVFIVSHDNCCRWYFSLKLVFRFCALRTVFNLLFLWTEFRFACLTSHFVSLNWSVFFFVTTVPVVFILPTNDTQKSLP